MTIWTPDLSGYSGPKYRALTEAIAAAIADGSLPPESKLPPQRELAWALGLSVGTVTRAYSDAGNRELVVGEVGRGTWVRTGRAKNIGKNLWGPARENEGPISLVMNLPPGGIAAPALAETFRDLGHVDDLGYLLDHQASGRIESHSASAAAWLSRVGLNASAEEVVLTNGAQHGILMALMATANPGDTVLAENLTYPPLRQMAHHFGLRLQGVDMDDEGLCPDALEDACRKSNARVLYCMPTLQSPTGSTMSTERRRDIARIARRYDLVIVEDDVFGFLPVKRPPPLATFAPERTLYVTSVSKSLAPGLRIGIVHVPQPYLEDYRNAVQMSCWMPSPVTAEITHRWIEDGTADRLNELVREEMTIRCNMAKQILGKETAGLKGLSYHTWFCLPETWTAEAFRLAAEQHGVKVATGEMFALKPGVMPQSLRLALGYETTAERLGQGLKIIAGLLAGNGTRQSSIV